MHINTYFTFKQLIQAECRDLLRLATEKNDNYFRSIISPLRPEELTVQYSDEIFRSVDMNTKEFKTYDRFQAAMAWNAAKVIAADLKLRKLANDLATGAI